jgi:hypothetical protein
MKLSKPDEDPNEPAENEDSSAEVVTLSERIETEAERLDYVETLAEQNSELWDAVDALEATLKAVRADVAGLYAAQPTDEQGRHIAVENGGESAWLPNSVDSHDPIDEFV